MAIFESNAVDIITSLTRGVGFMQTFESAQDAYNKKNDADFAISMQSLITKLGISIAQTDKERPKSSAISSYNEAILYLCANVMNDSEFYKVFEQSGINHNANLAKHTIQDSKVNFNTIASQYNILLEKLENKLFAPGALKHIALQTNVKDDIHKNVTERDANTINDQLSDSFEVMEVGGKFFAEITDYMGITTYHGKQLLSFTIRVTMERGKMIEPEILEVLYRDRHSKTRTIRGRSLVENISEFSFCEKLDVLLDDEVCLFVKVKYKVPVAKQGIFFRTVRNHTKVAMLRLRKCF